MFKSIKLCFACAVILCVSMTACNSTVNVNVSDTDTTPSVTANTTVTEATTSATTTASENTVSGEILYSDDFDYDNDGDDETIFFVEDGFNDSKDLILSAWYSDGDASSRFAEIVVSYMRIDDKSRSFGIFNVGTQHFVYVETELAMGLGVPTDCFTVIDGNPICVSDQFFKDNEEMFIFFVVVEDLPHIRECGPAAGVNNLYPLYWNGNEFKVYETIESDMEYVKKADVNNIVSGIDTASVRNVLISSNGLLHINYYNDEGKVNSKTYLLEDDIITGYYSVGPVFDKGVYRECMDVSDSAIISP